MLMNFFFFFFFSTVVDLKTWVRFLEFSRYKSKLSYKKEKRGIYEEGSALPRALHHELFEGGDDK